MAIDDTTPVTVDYTNKDYYSLRNALIARAQTRIPAWQGTDPNDFGVALIESMAYMGDMLSFYIDRTANEMSLETANQRSSILNLARMYGYIPSGYQSASTSIRFTNNSTVDITLPAETQLSGQYVSGESVINVIFQTETDVTIPALTTMPDTTEGLVRASHGENVSYLYPEEGGIAGELIGSSNGLPSQTFRLLENQVVDGSVRVFVKRNTTFEEWEYVERLTDAGPTDAVFTTYLDADNFVYVVLGDGVSGRIPPQYADVKAQYVKGGGAEGRIPENTLTKVYRVPGVNDAAAIQSAITMTHAAATGGLDPENTEVIRQVAPFALTAFDRAVTLNDYANLCLNSTRIGKAAAEAESFTSVTVYIAEAAENSAQDPYPGYNPTTYYTEYAAGTPEDALDGWESLKGEADAQLTGKTQIGVSYTLAPATFVPVQLDIKYTKLSQYTSSQVESAIKSVLETQFGYNQMSFGMTLYPEDIEYWLKLIPGVRNISVTNLDRAGGTITSRVPITAGTGEIFAILPSNGDWTVISEYGTTNPITNLNTSAVSLTFSSSTYSYVGTTSSASTTITATASGSPLITLKFGTTTTQLTSGVASSSQALTTGLNVFTVTVYAEDMVTAYTYTVTITKT